MRIVYLDSALGDLQWFGFYYHRVFSDGTGRAYRRLLAVEGLVAATPLIGTPHPERPSARRFVISGTPFTLIYRITDTQIEILRLWDNRQGK